MNPKVKNYSRKQRRNPAYHGEILDQHANALKQMENAVVRNIKSLNALNKDFTSLLRLNPADTITEGDMVVVDFVGRLVNEDRSLGDGFQGNSAKGMTIKTLGNGELVEGFEDQLVGLKVGDTVEVDLTFPEDYHPHLAKKDVKFFVAIMEVLREPANGGYVDQKLADLDKYNAEKIKKSEDSMKAAQKLAGVSEDTEVEVKS